MSDDRYTNAVRQLAELKATVESATAAGRFRDALEAVRGGQSIVSAAPLDQRQQFRDSLVELEADCVHGIDRLIAGTIERGDRVAAERLLAAAQDASNSVRSPALRGDLRERLRELGDQCDQLAPAGSRPASKELPRYAPQPPAEPEPPAAEPQRPAAVAESPAAVESPRPVPPPLPRPEPPPLPQPAHPAREAAATVTAPARPRRPAVSTRAPSAARRRQCQPRPRPAVRYWADFAESTLIRHPEPATYPLPPPSPDVTLRAWVRTHGAPPTREVAIRLLAAWGLRLPTEADMRRTRLWSSAPVWLRDHEDRLWLPDSQTVGYPPASDRRRQLRPV